MEPEVNLPARPESDEGLVCRTGVPGLDNVLGGGLPCGEMYLLHGSPGSGKTTLCLQFLLDGARAGETCLLVSLSENAQELRRSARSHGWSLDSIHICEIIPSEESLEPDSQFTMFYAAETELHETTARLIQEVRRLQPARVVVDSLSELRLLAQSSLRYRRQLLALKQFFAGRDCTVVMIDDRTAEGPDRQEESIAHGVVLLEQLAPEFGPERRRIRISKLRGADFRGGFHDFVISRGGLRVFPSLIAAEHPAAYVPEDLGSEVPALDALLGGGLRRGTGTLFIGPAGIGKTTVALQYAIAAAEKGERAVLFGFEEGLQTLRDRCAGLGMPLQTHLDSGRVRVETVDPAQLSPGEFGHKVRRAVEEDCVNVVIIDSLNGYLNAMPGERYLIIQLHELLTYLGLQGVVTIVILGQQGIIGSSMAAPVDASYLADTIVMFRYFEAAGEVRQAISVLKKRSGAHERSIRELKLSSDGILIGEPLSGFRGVLSGIPTLPNPETVLGV